MASHDTFELLEREIAELKPTYGKFVLKPLPNGFGNTIGNALRRVLLSSMEGVAVSTVKIDGVSHEFCTMPGVAEDVMEIILNIKKLKFTCDGDLPRKLELFHNQAGVVTAASIVEDGVTHVLNKDQVICTLDTDREIRMELEIDRGRGFRPSEENKHEDQPIGTIPVDCLFSPIERVRYDVRDCRVGSNTDYDMLELEVWTDGRIDPETAVLRSADLLRRYLAVFLGDEPIEPVQQVSPGLSQEDRELVSKLMMSVDDLELSVRAVNCLNSAQIHHLGELVEKSESQMLKYRNFGKKSLQEIREKLQEMGLGLEMTLKDTVRAEVLRQTIQQMQNTTEEENN